MFKKSPEGAEARNLFDMPRQQQLLSQIKRQKGSHPVVGKAFEGFGKDQIEQAEWMAQNRLFAPWRVGVVDSHVSFPNYELFVEAATRSGGCQ